MCDQFQVEKNKGSRVAVPSNVVDTTIFETSSVDVPESWRSTMEFTFVAAPPAVDVIDLLAEDVGLTHKLVTFVSSVYELTTRYVVPKVSPVLQSFIVLLFPDRPKVKLEPVAEVMNMRLAICPT